MECTGERMMPEFNQGQEIYLEHMTRYMFASQFVKDKVILDIACGSGYGSDFLLKTGAKKIIGVDISEETISYCKEKYPDDGIEFLIGSVEKIPIGNNSVDIIVSFETIEHVDEKAQIKFLKEIKRVLKSDGILIVSTPNSLVYPKWNKFHLKELDPGEFKNILKKSFGNVEMFYQDDVECSYIYSEDNLKNLSKKSEVNEKIDKILPEASMYLVAVCGDFDLDSIVEYVGLSNIKPFKQYTNLVEQIQQKDQEIQQKDQEINMMKSSKFWKIRGTYLRIKNRFTKLFQ